METNSQGASPILLLPAQGSLETEVRELQTPRGAPAARQRWEIGDTVRIGSQHLRVAELGIPPARKGEARGTRLVSHDLQRQYIWTPFRGLRVVGGKARKRRARPKAARAAPRGRPAPAQKVQRMSLIRRIWQAVGLH